MMSIDGLESEAGPSTFKEKCVFGKSLVEIPEDLCEKESLFNEVLSMGTWEKVLTEEQRAHLTNFLPSYSENDREEKQLTVTKLLTGENFRFGNPLQQFHKRLKDGFYSPDMVKMASLMRKTTYREYRYQQQRYYYKLLQDILISRKKLLEAASKVPPDQSVKMERLQPPLKKNVVDQRTKKRYFRELQELRDEVAEFDTSSEDENYPEGSPPKMTKKQRKQLFHIEAALSPDMARITSTTCTKSSNLENGGCSSSAVRSLSPFEVTEEHYREMLMNHKRRRTDGEDHPELDTGHIALQDVVMRTSMTKRTTPRPVSAAELSSKKKVKDKDKLEKKKKKVKPPVTAAVTSSPPPEEIVKIKTEVIEPEEISNITIKVEPPSEMDYVEESYNSQGPPRSASPPTLIQDTFLSFFSLLRDIIYKELEQRISTQKLEDEVRAWQEGPFAGLNEWYMQQVSWPDQVFSALKFLAGDLPGMHLDNFVPYLDFKDKIQMWQWIGVGRDSDENMASLCKSWLENKDDIPLVESLDSTPGSPPPPRIHTEWIVRPTSEEERSIYREQERKRYESPHKAFTFQMHDYESVVGPVKGVYGKESGTNKAREHSLLVSDRPPFVTILSLVRDAAARLPNGEGTRADICQLLKDSQYLALAADSQIHTVVSGALDRLHYEKDPCVKYDVNRKLWIYLHRSRTEEEFERIHQVYAAAAKAKKTVPKTKVPRVKNKESIRPASSISPGVSENSLSLDIVGGTAGASSAVSPASGHSPRGGSSPRAHQTSPKASATSNKPSRSSLASPKQTAAASGVPNLVTTQATPKTTSVAPVSSLPTTANVAATLPMNVRSPSVETVVSPQVSAATPAPFVLPQNHPGSRPSSTGSAQSLPSPKAVIANVNATQFVSVSQVQISSGAISPKIASAPTTPTSQPKTVSNLLSQQQALQQLVAKQQAALSAAAQAGTVKSTTLATSSTFAPTVSAVKLLSSTGPQTDVLLSKAAASSIMSSAIGQPALQGLQTIMIKQDTGCHVVSTTGAIAGSPKTTFASGNKPVVARIISSPQVVSMGNLIASTLAAQKQGGTLQGATTIKIQGGNIVRPVGGKPGQMNVIQTTAGTTTLPRLAVVSQGGTGNLIPVTCATVTAQSKLVATASGQLGVMASQLTAQQVRGQLAATSKPTILTTQGGMKILSTASPGMSLAHLGGKPGQTMVVTTKHQTPSSVAVCMASTTTAGQNVILAGGVQTTTPTVVIASQGALKPAQTVVMAAAGTAQTVVMAAQAGMRPIAAVTPVNMKALQGVKVIPVSQASGSKGKTQPVFARIITPPAGLTLRPAGALTAAQQGISVIQSVAAIPAGTTTATIRPGTTTVNSPYTAGHAAIIRLQAPPPTAEQQKGDKL